MTAPYQLVTLVTEGGVPAQLVDQFGAPFATTGTGALVFANGPTLSSPLFVGGITVDDVTVTGNASVGGTLDVSGLATLGAASITGDLAVGGTITSGLWHGTTIGVDYGGTGLTSYAVGDLLYASATTTLASLPIGSEGQVLTVSGGVPVWAADLSGVTSFSAGTTGLTPSTPTGGAVVLAGTLSLTNGGTGTNLSATGGTSQVLRQSSAGAAITVSQLAASDLSNGTTGTGAVVLASNASLTAPSFSTIVNTGTLTLPTSTDTLIGRATSDTLTNKSISGASNTLSNIDNSSLTNSSVTINGSAVSLGGSITVTAAASSITVGTTSVASGTNTYILYNNAGTLGNFALGTGVQTALGTNVGSAGAFVVNGGALGTPSSGTLTNATGLPIDGGTSGTLPILRGGTGQTTASAAFNALSPITSTGDLIIGNGANSATRLAIGTSNYVLTSNGTTASWQPVPGASLAVGSSAITGGTTGRVLYDNAGTLGEYTVTGTAGSVVLSDAPSLTGIVSSTNIKYAFLAQNTGTNQTSFGLYQSGMPTDQKYWEIVAGPTVGTFAIRTVNDAYSAYDYGLAFTRGTGTTVSAAYIYPPLTLSGALTYGGVTFSNSVTGTGSLVGSASPAFTGTPTFAGATSGTIGLVATAVAGSNTLTLPAATDTLVGKATTDIFTNKTFDTAGTGNVFKINGTQITDKTGTGKAVLDTSPTISGLTVTGLFTGVGSDSVASYLTGNVTLTNINQFYDGPNTGSIGANGQIWAIFASGAVYNNSQATYGEIAIYNGSTYLTPIQGSVGGAAGWTALGTVMAIVTLTGPTTFTLRAASNVANSILNAATAIGGGRPTYIMAVRLK